MNTNSAQDKEPVLIITYYWPPAGGSGVQRWMYFAKYLPQNGFTPYVVTVDPGKASYKFTDESFLQHVAGLQVYPTNTREPLKLYSRLTTGKSNKGIPQAFAGEEKPGIFKKITRFIRGNFFIPDARKGWNGYAYKQALELIHRHNIKKVITTGPPHSTHLVGLKLKRTENIHWVADFRDPWRELFYNKLLYRTRRADARDAGLELKVLQTADTVLTIGPSMQQKLAEKIKDGAQKVKFIYNGFDSDVFSAIARQPDSQKFVITHIGMLGETQPIDAFLQGLRQAVQHHPGFAATLLLRLVGNVSPVIVESISLHFPGLAVQVIPYVPHKQALQYMVNSSLLFNSLPETQAASYLISGKLMEYLASGNPVFCLGDTNGDAAKLVGQFAHCTVCARNDIGAIADYFKGIIAAAEQGIALQHDTAGMAFSREKTAQELAALLRQS